MNRNDKKKLQLDQNLVSRSRQAAQKIADDIEVYITENTTVSVERAVARLLGINGVGWDEVPLPNVIVNQVHQEGKLDDGIAYWIGNAMIETGDTPQNIAKAIDDGALRITRFKKNSRDDVEAIISPLMEKTLKEIQHIRHIRTDLQERLPLKDRPWLYVIVATGDIYEDVLQAKAAARQGADIIAVIRSTAQSLLDYVPYGATTEGFGGTYATQENFRIMRQALDEVGNELGRYIQLVNYCSGLCMPEIAVMGALERLDMLLNDAMYGILFRNINMERTFIDQHFSRMLNAYAGIIINTGEDNYLTTADSLEEAHTVTASQFINEELALRAGLAPYQIGLGHAFELDPNKPDGLLLEIAQAQLTRQLFPESTLKYMPPTKYMTGDIFKGHLMNGMFNLVSVMTGQDIQLLGMLTEAIHTPFIQDRALSIENADYIFNNARSLLYELDFSTKGQIASRAAQMLYDSVEMLEQIADSGLMTAIEQGVFADISRDRNGGKGRDGVVKKSESYLNPISDMLRKELALHA